MVTVRFTEFNFYSLLDADSDEARTFTTYLGYWICLAQQVEDRYGVDPPAAIHRELVSRRPFRSLPGRGRPADPAAIRTLMLNGWISELRLNLIDHDDDRRLTVANHGAPVDSCYATSRHATAWLTLRDGSSPVTHRGLLNAVSAQVTGSRLLPPPWDLACTAIKPTPLYHGFPSVPGRCNNLAAAADSTSRAGMLLRTTRDRGIRSKVEEEKRRLHLSRARAGEAQRQDRKLPPTTVFDFAWRMRKRSNYDDPAMFYVGSLGPERARTYALAIRKWTAATMFLFEALLAQRAAAVVEEAAVHFISRDRSGLAEQLLVPRLHTLGLLAEGSNRT